MTNNFKIIKNIEFKTSTLQSINPLSILILKTLKKFGNKMLKPVISKYMGNMNQNSKRN